MTRPQRKREQDLRKENDRLQGEVKQLQLSLANIRQAVASEVRAILFLFNLVHLAGYGNVFSRRFS